MPLSNLARTEITPHLTSPRGALEGKHTTRGERDMRFARQRQAPSPRLKTFFALRAAFRGEGWGEGPLSFHIETLLLNGIATILHFSHHW